MLTKKDVQAMFTASSSIRNSGMNLADYLNLYPKYVDNTTVGGGSFEFHLSHALTAIAAGRIECAVITYSSLAKSGGVSVGTGGAARYGHPLIFLFFGAPLSGLTNLPGFPADDYQAFLTAMVIVMAVIFSGADAAMARRVFPDSASRVDTARPVNDGFDGVTGLVDVDNDLLDERAHDALLDAHVRRRILPYPRDV